MSEGDRIFRAEALNLAAPMIQLLEMYCSRVEIAGSLRRGKPDVGDIELVCIPIVDEYVPFLQGGIAACCKVIKGGPKFIQVDLGPCKCDIFLTTAEQWGLIFLLRTGPRLFSMLMVTTRNKGGRLPNDMCVQDGFLWRDGERVPTLEEADVFKALGMEFIPPEERM